MATKTKDQDRRQRIISKRFETLKEAEDFLFGLYSQYDSATCIQSPVFSEAGIYNYRVNGEIK